MRRWHLQQDRSGIPEVDQGAADRREHRRVRNVELSAEELAAINASTPGQRGGRETPSRSR